jgi:hypothetical protein
MKTRWKLWLIGIALVQLLVIGVDAALLWPMPGEAERDATKLRVGMTARDVRDLIDLDEVAFYKLGSKLTLLTLPPSGNLLTARPWNMFSVNRQTFSPMGRKCAWSNCVLAPPGLFRC